MIQITLIKLLYIDFILSTIKHNFNYILVQTQQLTLKQSVKYFPRFFIIKNINIVTEVVFMYVLLNLNIFII